MVWKLREKLCWWGVMIAMLTCNDRYPSSPPFPRRFFSQLLPSPPKSSLQPPQPIWYFSPSPKSSPEPHLHMASPVISPLYSSFPKHFLPWGVVYLLILPKESSSGFFRFLSFSSSGFFRFSVFYHKSPIWHTKMISRSFLMSNTDWVNWRTQISTLVFIVVRFIIIRYLSLHYSFSFFLVLRLDWCVELDTRSGCMEV